MLIHNGRLRKKKEITAGRHCWRNDLSETHQGKHSRYKAKYWPRNLAGLLNFHPTSTHTTWAYVTPGHVGVMPITNLPHPPQTPPSAIYNSETAVFEHHPTITASLKPPDELALRIWKGCRLPGDQAPRLHPGCCWVGTSLVATGLIFGSGPECLVTGRKSYLCKHRRGSSCSTRA